MTESASTEDNVLHNLLQQYFAVERQCGQAEQLTEELAKELVQLQLHHPSEVEVEGLASNYGVSHTCASNIVAILSSQQ